MTAFQENVTEFTDYLPYNVWLKDEEKR